MEEPVTTKIQGYLPSIVMAVTVIGTAAVMIFKVNTFETKFEGIEAKLQTINDTLIRQEADGAMLRDHEGRLRSVEGRVTVLEARGR